MPGTVDSDTSDTTEAPIAKDRQAVLELAWRPFRLMSEGREQEALAVFDDSSTWWEITGRTEQPTGQLKPLLSEIHSVVPCTFELIGSIIEGHRVALMVESHGHIDDDTTYNNAYNLVMTVDPDRDVILDVREYCDTLHVATVLVPALERAVDEHADKPAIMAALGKS